MQYLYGKYERKNVFNEYKYITIVNFCYRKYFFEILLIFMLLLINSF